MREGDLVGRWRLLAEAPADGTVRRFRAVATDTGEPAELLTLRPGTPAEGRRAFVQAHRALQHARDPALAPTLEITESDDGPVVVRAPLEDATLADVPGPLPPETVAAIGARLLPAVLAAGPGTGGALLPTDVGLDAFGKPVLAPRARPLSHVDRAVGRAVAPECFAGVHPDGASGLYGLGMVLYTLATGREPQRATVRGERAPPPAPSILHHAVPPALDAAILKLLSNRPEDRAGAMPMLQDLAGPDQLAGPRADLRDHVRARIPEVSTTVGGEAPSRAVAVAPASARVVLPARQLEMLDPAGRSRAAGWAGLPLTVVEALAEAGLPLVVEEATSSSVAKRRALELARDSGLPLTSATSAAFASFAVMATAGALVTGALTVGAILLLLGLWPLAVVAFTLGALVAAGGAWAWGRATAGGALHTAAQRSARKAAELTADLDPDRLLGGTWTQLAQVRKALASTELPEAASVDLRSALKDVERRLHGMAEVARTARQALVGLDPARLRTRLSALEHRAATDPSARDERDQLARALADLDAVEQRRASISEDARRIDATLGEIRTVLARVASTGDVDDPTLAQLVETARAARRAAVHAPASEPPRRPPPRRVEES